MIVHECIIETKRLYLREMNHDDFDALYKVLADPEIMQHYPYAFANTDYPALYSYCKYTNIGSYKTAESIGMHLLKEYPNPENVITRVSVILRAEYSSGR